MNHSVERGRQRGQVMVMVALLLPALLGMTGVAIDLGFGYVHRRQMQNGADAGTLAGTAALGRHYFYQANKTVSTGATLTPLTDAQILQEVTSAAAASTPPFPAPATNPSWPTGAGNSLTANYILTNGASPPTYTLGPVVGGGSIPATAAGVRVQTQLRHDTLFARIFGSCCDHVDATASATSLLYPLASAGGAPFIVCGGEPGVMNPHGAWKVAPAPEEHRVQLLDHSMTPPKVKPGYIGATFRVHDEQIGKQGGGPNAVEADCGAGASYKGNADPNDICDALGSTQLPCLLAGQNGTRAGPTRNRVNGLPGCGKEQGNNCVAVLPIANGYQSGQLRVVVYGCFRLTQIGANSHNGTLLGACAADGEVDTVRGFDPTNPGAFTWKLAPGF